MSRVNFAKNRKLIRKLKNYENFACRRIPGESKLNFESISRQLYRLRDKQYPKRPSTDEEIQQAFENDDIFAEYGRTLDKRRPFYAGSVVKKNRYAFHVFASFGIIDMVKKHIPPEQRKFLLDGTFKIVPRRFRQLLIIAIEYKNDVCSSTKIIDALRKIILICYHFHRYSRSVMCS